MPAADLTLLHNWQNFYMIVGTAAATLTGLMFVGVSLVAGTNRQRATLDAGISAFSSPTVAHFFCVLLISGMLSAPWPAFGWASYALGLLGLGMVVYLIGAMQHMQRVADYQTPLKDWVWYMAFPLSAYIALVVAAIALPANPAPVLFLVSAAMLALLFLGLHNAWDLVTYLAVERSNANQRDAE